MISVISAIIGLVVVTVLALFVSVIRQLGDIGDDIESGDSEYINLDL